MEDPESHLKRLGIELPDVVESSSTALLERSNRTVVNGQFYWTSGGENAIRFRAAPYLYSGPVRDPITGELFTPTDSSPRRDTAIQILYFIDLESAERFDEDPTEVLE